MPPELTGYWEPPLRVEEVEVCEMFVITDEGGEHVCEVPFGGASGLAMMQAYAIAAALEKVMAMEVEEYS